MKGGASIYFLFSLVICVLTFRIVSASSASCFPVVAITFLHKCCGVMWRKHVGWCPLSPLKLWQTLSPPTVWHFHLPTGKFQSRNWLFSLSSPTIFKWGWPRNYGRVSNMTFCESCDTLYPLYQNGKSCLYDASGLIKKISVFIWWISTGKVLYYK